MQRVQSGNGRPSGAASLISSAARPYDLMSMEMSMEWKDQYKHPQWQKKRLEVLEAALFTCEQCGNEDRQLHVHHKQYFKGRKIWDYSLDELEALCDSCHEEKHKANDAIKNLLTSLSSADIDRVIGYMSGINAVSTFDSEFGHTHLLNVTSYEFAEGLGDAIGENTEEIIEIAMANDGKVSFDLIQNNKKYKKVI